MTQIIRPQASTYKITIRSFHPENSFGWSGLAFGGDSRGFSLKPNKTKKGGNGVPSRIWHDLKIDLKRLIHHSPNTFSNSSKAKWSSEGFEYDNPVVSPKDSVFVVKSQQKKDNKTYAVKGKYWGSNHAMPLSPLMQEKLGFTYVPDINVQYELFLTLDFKESTLIVGARVSGDGFPNTEGFITDSSGKSVFLGTHVRQGVAPTTLVANATHPLFKNVLKIPLNVHGLFKDSLYDEGERYLKNRPTAKQHNISNWNQKFLDGNPNQGHCMGLEELKRFRECF